MSRFPEFQKLYLMILRTGRSCRESYELAERAYKKKYGQRAYSNYSSFTTQQSKKHKNGMDKRKR